MKKAIICLVTIVLISILFIKVEIKEYSYENGYPEKISLTPEQVNEDFEYLFTNIEENYPYLEVNKQLIGVDFVGNKEKYRETLKDVTNAEQLYVGLSRMMKHLNNGHTQLIGREGEMNRNAVHKLFSAQKEKNFRYEEETLRLDVLSDENTFKFYGAIREKTTKENWLKNKFEHKKSFSNANSSSVFMKDVIGDTGYLRVDRMHSDGFDTWKKELDTFFKDNDNLNSLIIDIRNNQGGNSAFVYEVLVKPLLKEKTFNQTYDLYKDGEYNIELLKSSYGKDYDKVVKDIKLLDKTKLPNAPKEIFEDFDLYVDSGMWVEPKDSYDFEGNIYLLVGEKVFSSSERLAIFAKQTGFATLVGETTGGDGSGITPGFFVLPNSGIIVRSALENSLLEDGTIEELEKIKPDYYVEFSDFNGILEEDPCIKKVLELEGSANN